MMISFHSIAKKWEKTTCDRCGILRYTTIAAETPTEMQFLFRQEMQMNLNKKGVLNMKGEFTQKGKEAMERFKMESANEVGVNLKQGYNGDLTARQAGSIGGMMVKKMIDAYKMQ